jgi:hypothetical protein
MQGTLRSGMTTLAACFLLNCAVQAANAPAIDVKEVKYSGLADTIKKNKGKVIVVDFWALW